MTTVTLFISTPEFEILSEVFEILEGYNLKCILNLKERYIPINEYRGELSRILNEGIYHQHLGTIQLNLPIETYRVLKKWCLTETKDGE